MIIDSVDSGDARLAAAQRHAPPVIFMGEEAARKVNLVSLVVGEERKYIGALFVCVSAGRSNITTRNPVTPCVSERNVSSSLSASFGYICFLSLLWKQQPWI
ncbi:hypothetical protein E2C01_017896 [Portunus trituberculatus]|uniref:Uncharacterized protein n=1 Tax=Portunus trituberculatus TaxID=210409 RepID=A0A5B7DT20_PORTR|nr:hypothetical protein [Portunus trituberculatus]